MIRSKACRILFPARTVALIKELAQQTAAATEDIKAKIGGVQTSAGSVIADIEKITSVVGDVGQFKV